MSRERNAEVESSRLSWSSNIFALFSSENKTKNFFSDILYFVLVVTAAIFENNENPREEKSPKLKVISKI